MGSRSTLALAIAIGAGLEFGVQALGARREAWDSPLFWSVGMPVALCLAFVIGFFAQGRAWLSTIAVAPAQFMAMTLRNGELGGLWPLGLVLSCVLSLPFVVTSFVGSRVGRTWRSPAK